MLLWCSTCCRVGTWESSTSQWSWTPTCGCSSLTTLISTFLCGTCYKAETLTLTFAPSSQICGPPLLSPWISCLAACWQSCCCCGYTSPHARCLTSGACLGGPSCHNAVQPATLRLPIGVQLHRPGTSACRPGGRWIRMASALWPKPCFSGGRRRRWWCLKLMKMGRWAG